MFRVTVLLGVCGIVLSKVLVPLSLTDVVYADTLQPASKTISALPKSSKRPANGVAAGRFSGRGGYSFTQQDTINTYGDSRSRYGSAVSLRDPQMDRQSIAGPFDQGFFFDSAITPRGGEAPYLN